MTRLHDTSSHRHVSDLHIHISASYLHVSISRTFFPEASELYFGGDYLATTASSELVVVLAVLWECSVSRLASYLEFTDSGRTAGQDTVVFSCCNILLFVYCVSASFLCMLQFIWGKSMEIKTVEMQLTAINLDFTELERQDCCRAHRGRQRLPQRTYPKYDRNLTVWIHVSTMKWLQSRKRNDEILGLCVCVHFPRHQQLLRLQRRTLSRPRRFPAGHIAHFTSYTTLNTAHSVIWCFMSL